MVIKAYYADCVYGSGQAQSATYRIIPNLC